jgi:hypothetical protein
VLAGGIVGTNPSNPDTDAEVLGVGKTEIIGLVNGETYLVVEVA